MQTLTDPEDVKLLTLARATRARTGAPAAAGIRDLDGRTYAAASVALPSLRLGAVGAAVSMAVSSAAQGLEAVVVMGQEQIEEADLQVVRDFAGSGVAVSLVDPRGHLVITATS